MSAAEFFRWFTPIAVGLISAYVASLLALRKFKREKVWDERRTAYKELIETVEEIIYWAEQVRASHCCEPTIGHEGDVNASLRTLAKYSATGALIFSDKFHEVVMNANIRIHKLMFQIDDESMPDLHSEREMADWRLIQATEIRKILEECLPELIRVAKSEQI
ncbi:hypothetical protein [Saccharospirillum salsuginis]|uniref:Uncharacterized protein n=1 Tax=Saccharospirillum salsuginis TaxID=418750 RepID=A0A918KS96_9GAMM|nr:hypothetical protein [Saccharospirillum salsuginis]GGX71444.1 hypothetical protein GCM10007392_43710 [Saccharospirillum salsuginis]